MAAKGASAQNVDFSGVKDRGNFNPKQVEEGDYSAIITKVEDGESKSDQTFMYVFTIKLQKYSQHAYPYYCKLSENQLWKLRNLLIAAGLNVPKKKLKLDPNKVVGKVVGVTMADDEYDGKMKSVVDAIFPASELGDNEIADTAVDEDADEDDDEVETTATVDSADDVDDDEDEEEPKPKKKKKGKKKKAADDDVEELDLDAM